MAPAPETPKAARPHGQSPALWLFIKRVSSGAHALGGPRLRGVVLWLARLVLRAVAYWQRSLQARVVSSTMVLGLAATSLVGVVLSEQVADRLTSVRRDQAFRDATRATAMFTAEMDSYTRQSGSPFDSYVREQLDGLRNTLGNETVGVLLLRTGTAPAGDGSPSYGTVSPTIIPAELRTAVTRSLSQQSANIALTANGRVVAGLVIGQPVQIRTVQSSYELYFVLSLAPEQATLDSIQRVIGAGMITLVLLLGFIAWLVSRQVVNPVKEAALVAGRLSEGALDERMDPRGRDELARLARSFNDMADSLQDQIEAMAELSRLQRRFVSDVSHELRTPLTTIRMAAEVIDADRADFTPVIARSSELLATQLDRFEDLLADLLEISRFDAGAAALEAGDSDLSSIVRRVVELAAPLAEAKSSPLELHLPKEPAIAQVDSRRIERVVRNLIVNAVEHAEAKPVEIWVAADDRTAAVLIVDHGIGLRPGDAEHVFDRFWRADPARARTTGGTGLGLAISLEDALLHGGSLRAWGLPGEGARFLLVLPVVAGTVPGRSPLPLTPPGHEDDEDDQRGPGPAADPEEAWLISELAIDREQR